MGNRSARAITFLCKTVPNAKHLQKLGTLEIRIIRKKRKISVPHFQSKFEVGKKKNSFHNIQFLLLPLLTKTHKFSHAYPFHPHPKQHKILSTYLCAVSWSIKTLNKAIHSTELQQFYRVLLCKTDILTNWQQWNNNFKIFKIISRMCINSYIIYKEQ